MGAAVCPFMIYGEIVQRWRLAQGAVLRKWPRAQGQRSCLPTFSRFTFWCIMVGGTFVVACICIWDLGRFCCCVQCCTRYLHGSLPLPSRSLLHMPVSCAGLSVCQPGHNKLRRCCLCQHADGLLLCHLQWSSGAPGSWSLYLLAFWCGKRCGTCQTALLSARGCCCSSLGAL